MVLSEKETAAIKDLQTQEKTCVEKYSRSGSREPVHRSSQEGAAAL